MSKIRAIGVEKRQANYRPRFRPGAFFLAVGRLARAVWRETFLCGDAFRAVLAGRRRAFETFLAFAGVARRRLAFAVFAWTRLLLARLCTTTAFLTALGRLAGLALER